jgi:dTDP-4-dehydrorhamnose reductase
MMRVLLLGGSGQLGHCLQDRRPDDWSLCAPASAQLDVRNGASVDKAVAELRPDLVINAAACNQVDMAEQAPAAAYAVNAEGAGHVARAAARAGARLIHISTDYVFDGLCGGRPATRPYAEDAAAHPLNVYGASKRQGELAVLAANPDAMIVRTAWLFSEYGRNFVRAILERVRAGQPLRVVDDQVGSPTYAGDLAQVLIRLGGAGVRGATPPGGIYHFCGAEVLSWYQFACRIAAAVVAPANAATRAAKLAESRPKEPGPLAQAAVPGAISIAPITSGDYASPARRPAYSALSCDKMCAMGMSPRPLAPGLARVLEREQRLCGARAAVE